MPDARGEDDPAFVAVDWGTTRLRAALVAGSGAVLGRVEAETGVQAVPPGGFPAALAEACGPWLAARPGLPVVMAGMVGSRNGWVEAPYAPCPCGADDLAARLTRVEGAYDVLVAPGADCRWPDGAYDVMRGEEVQALGTGVADGLLCLPGTHSKWIAMAGGRIARFATFVTGELYAAMSASFIGRLAAEPADGAAGRAAGARAAAWPGGLGRLLFQARAQVLGGGLPGAGVRPFLSSLIVGQEISGAADLFGAVEAVHLVAAPPQLDPYREALEARGATVTLHDPAEASLAGLARLFAASGDVKEDRNP